MDSDNIQLQSDISRRLGSAKVSYLELQQQRDTVASETNFRWLQLILFSIIILGLLGFWVFQRTTIQSNYSNFIDFVNYLRQNGYYHGPGSGYDWAWYFKYPRLAFSMPNINLPAAAIFGWYNDTIHDEMIINKYCLQEMYIMAQNRPQATAAQILCTWYMASSQSANAKACQNICPPTDPYLMSDFLNTTFNTTIQLTAAAAEVSGGNPAVIGTAFMISAVLGLTEAKNNANRSATDCQATQRNCISHYSQDAGTIQPCGVGSGLTG
jgi:hypothetical protein